MCNTNQDDKNDHEDQHFVDAMTRYVLEWLIELRAVGSPVEFVGGDNKAKIAVGDEVVSRFIFCSFCYTGLV